MTGGASPDSPPPAAPPGWRKRHPVLARTLLYGLCAAVAAVVLTLLLQRRDVDRSDRLRYLAARLESLDVVFMAGGEGGAPGEPGGWQTVLAVLDQEFADPDLPRDLKARALRWRGLAETKGGRLPAAEAAFAAALDLAPDPMARGAVLVEWAEARAHLGDAPGAVALLDRPDLPADQPLGLLSALVRAYALDRAGTPAEARRGLESALAGLPGEPPATPSLRVGTRDWTPADAAREVRRHLRLGG